MKRFISCFFILPFVQLLQVIAIMITNIAPNLCLMFVSIYSLYIILAMVNKSRYNMILITNPSDFVIDPGCYKEAV